MYMYLKLGGVGTSKDLNLLIVKIRENIGKSHGKNKEFSF